MEYNKVYLNLSLNHHAKLSLITHYWNGAINIIPTEAETQYLELYEKFKDNKLKNNTSVYLTPMANLPSYKLKNYIEENKLNINLTRVYPKLNAIIIDDNFIRESYFSTAYWKPHKHHIIPVDYIESKFKKYIPPDKTTFKTSINNKPIDGFLITEEDIKEWAKIDFAFLGLLDFPFIYGRALGKSHGFKKAHDNYKAFCGLKETVEKYNLEIIFDNTINNEINKDMVMDIEMFQNVFNMLVSNDKGNTEIAKEIIANCSLDESNPYIIYLFNIFVQLRKTSDNKNFNFIRKTLNKETIQSWTPPGKNALPSTDSFIPDLLKKNPKFTPQYMDCFKIHLNYLAKKDLIKEIILS